MLGTVTRYCQKMMRLIADTTALDISLRKVVQGRIRIWEAVVLNTQSGYIVARYQRPIDVGDDESAEDALDAPCKLL